MISCGKFYQLIVQWQNVNDTFRPGIARYRKWYNLAITDAHTSNLNSHSLQGDRAKSVKVTQTNIKMELKENSSHHHHNTTKCSNIFPNEFDADNKTANRMKQQKKCEKIRNVKGKKNICGSGFTFKLHSVGSIKGWNRHFYTDSLIAPMCDHIHTCQYVFLKQLYEGRALKLMISDWEGALVATQVVMHLFSFRKHPERVLNEF